MSKIQSVTVASRRTSTSLQHGLATQCIARRLERRNAHIMQPQSNMQSLVCDASAITHLIFPPLPSASCWPANLQALPTTARPRLHHPRPSPPPSQRPRRHPPRRCPCRSPLLLSALVSPPILLPLSLFLFSTLSPPVICRLGPQIRLISHSRPALDANHSRNFSCPVHNTHFESISPWYCYAGCTRGRKLARLRGSLA